MTPPVRVLLFATAREAVGRAELLREVPAGGVSVAAFLSELLREFPQLAPATRGSRFVVNGEYVRGRSGRLVPGDEFAIHPPFSGG